MENLCMVVDYDGLKKLASQEGLCVICFSELKDGKCPLSCQNFCTKCSTKLIGSTCPNCSREPLQLPKKHSILFRIRKRRSLAKPKIVKKSI